jgi:hypothetical protein
MSTLTYAAITTNREQAQPGTSTSESPPGVKTYVDALAALVPAEVLTLHALILAVTTQTGKTQTGQTQATITQVGTLSFAFWGLALLSIALYAGYRLMAAKWDRLDYVRMTIPPLAFVGWTMLQRTTAFDAAFPQLTDAPRTVAALFLGVLLGLAAAALAYKADQKPPG